MAKLDSLFPEEVRPPGAPAAKAGSSASRPMVAKPSMGGPSAPAPARSAPLNSPSATPGARIFVSDMQPGRDCEGIYLVQEATLRAAKNGSKYIQAAVGDKSGSIPVRMWDAKEEDLETFKAGCYIKLRGRVETYQNRLQLIAFAIQDADTTGINPSDFLPVSVRPLDEMVKEFDAFIASIADPDYKRLLESLFADPKVRDGYIKGPAANGLHHAWVHGLLEHVLSACKTAQSAAEQRPFLNRDLLITGVLLHDIGKIEELDAGPGFNYTDTGRLCGHIVLGALLIERHIVKLAEFPQKKRDLIIHMILSHHGELEYGSPVKPFTAEAIALHHIECMDAKIQGVQSIIEKEAAAGNTGNWSEFSRMVDGRIYKG